ncbi:hypothetical protein ACFQMA_14300 [Halosimplex aquaticum]|uniref:DUF7344 domain-containing protein n=1 Tax=Halosimplex aquaticum TaxID=3026162 RepID=A0ABD5Y179_9EURY|nr:hypothetical protein [Halosimplex aquaticum]
MDIPTVPPTALDALSASVRRAALAALRDRESATSVDALASAVASRLSRSSANGHADVDGMRRSLYHAHLPVLGQTGAVTFDPESGLVAAANEPPFDEAWVGRLVTDHPDREYDSLLDALASARRQAVLYELFIGESATVDALADAVAVHERDGAEASEPVSRVVGLSLAHIHLPLLADVGLVACDPAAETVHAGETAWRSHPWVGLSPIGEWAAVE